MDEYFWPHNLFCPYKELGKGHPFAFLVAGTFSVKEVQKLSLGQ